MRNSAGGGGHQNGIYIDSQHSEDKYAIVLGGRTKVQSRAQASCGPEIIGISVHNFFFFFSFPCIVIHKYK